MTASKIIKSVCTRKSLIGSLEWYIYFQNNEKHHKENPVVHSLALTKSEIKSVIRSIQIFQLGESGEGVHFLACAEKYAKRSNDHYYLLALRKFLAEENRHADLLGRILDAQHVRRIKKNWTDVAFRWLRHRAGLELTIMVLLTAEVIAQVYYQALRDATACVGLQKMCSGILRDEMAHVRFQAERLAMLRKSRRRPLVAAIAFVERLLFFITIVVVWHTHRSVFRAARMAWRKYWRKLWNCFSRAQKWGNPNSFDGVTNDKPYVANLYFGQQPDRKQSAVSQSRSDSDKWLD